MYLDILKSRLSPRIPYEEDIIITTYFVTFMLLVWSCLRSRGTKLVSNVVKIDHMDRQLKWTRERKHACTYTNTQRSDIKPLFSLFTVEN